MTDGESYVIVDEQMLGAVQSLLPGPVDVSAFDFAMASRLLVSRFADTILRTFEGCSVAIPFLRITERGVLAARPTCVRLSAGPWEPIATAPTTGRIVDVDLAMADDRIIEKCHWAHGDGEGIQPQFGPAWFVAHGAAGFVEVGGSPLFWRPHKEDRNGGA